MIKETKLSWKKLLFSVTILLILPATIAYAGFFSIFGDVFSRVSTEQKQITSQNVSLLAAASVVDFSVKEHQTDVNTVDGSALLPDAGPVGAMADVSDQDFDHGQISIYVVHEGDSFASIAKMFNVSVNTIIWANNLSKGAKLAIGETLVILPVSGVEYVVKKGDSIQSIAKKYKGDPEEVSTYNNIALNEILVVGSTLIIPDGEMPTITPKKTRPATLKLHGANGPSLDGYYQAPLASYRKTQGLHGYNGVDLVQYVGASVFAAATGDVIVARQGGYNGGYGNYVVIQHDNGTQTLYGHLQSITVSSGQHIMQGQTLGYMGNSGRSTGPHLHFEVRGARNPF